MGIDIICKTIDGEFWASQCKFYAELTPIIKSAVDNFLATSSKTFNGQKNYNEHITIKNIPLRCFDYVVNERSPLEWIIDR